MEESNFEGEIAAYPAPDLPDLLIEEEDEEAASYPAMDLPDRPFVKDMVKTINNNNVINYSYSWKEWGVTRDDDEYSTSAKRSTTQNNGEPEGGMVSTKGKMRHEQQNNNNSDLVAKSFQKYEIDLESVLNVSQSRQTTEANQEQQDQTSLENEKEGKSKAAAAEVPQVPGESDGEKSDKKAKSEPLDDPQVSEESDEGDLEDEFILEPTGNTESSMENNELELDGEFNLGDTPQIPTENNDNMEEEPVEESNPPDVEQTSSGVDENELEEEPNPIDIPEISNEKDEDILEEESEPSDVPQIIVENDNAEMSNENREDILEDESEPSDVPQIIVENDNGEFEEPSPDSTNVPENSNAEGKLTVPSAVDVSKPSYSETSVNSSTIPWNPYGNDKAINSFTTISPGNTLEFCVTGPGVQPTDVISIKSNLSDKSVAFKVKTTTLGRYKVRPAIGIIKPNETIEVIITLEEKIEDPAQVTKDKFLIICQEVDSEVLLSQVSDLIRAVPKDLQSEHRLKVMMTKAESFNTPRKTEANHTAVPSSTKNSVNAAGAKQLDDAINRKFERICADNAQLESRLSSFGRIMFVQCCLLLVLIYMVMSNYWNQDLPNDKSQCQCKPWTLQE